MHLAAPCILLSGRPPRHPHLGGLHHCPRLLDTFLGNGSKSPHWTRYIVHENSEKGFADVSFVNVTGSAKRRSSSQ